MYLSTFLVTPYSQQRPPSPASLSLAYSVPPFISPPSSSFFFFSSTEHPSSCLFCLVCFFLSVFLPVSLSPWCGVSGWGATLSDSNCTDVNDILLMLSATSDTGARRGHSAAQTQGCSQTTYRNSLKVKSDYEREKMRSRRGKMEGENGLVETMQVIMFMQID